MMTKISDLQVGDIVSKVEGIYPGLYSFMVINIVNMRHLHNFNEEGKYKLAIAYDVLFDEAPTAIETHITRRYVGDEMVNVIQPSCYCNHGNIEYERL